MMHLNVTIPFHKDQHILEEKWPPDAGVERFKHDAMDCTKSLYHYIHEILITYLYNINLWSKLRRNAKPKRSRELKRFLGQ